MYKCNDLNKENFIQNCFNSPIGSNIYIVTCFENYLYITDSSKCSNNLILTTWLVYLFYLIAFFCRIHIFESRYFQDNTDRQS